MDLHIDIETYSSVDLRTSGAYKYVESLDFEILLIAYAFNEEPVRIIDLAAGEEIPETLKAAIKSQDVVKHAHNATFERAAFNTAGLFTTPNQWRCSMAKAAYCGFPLSLENVSTALKLEEKGKATTGRALIKYFCEPCKPSKINLGRTRNLPGHEPAKWEAFKDYCKQDVEAERSVDQKLSGYNLPRKEILMYTLDQQINDRGIQVDLELAEKAYQMDASNTTALKKGMKELTGIDNPNSPVQLKEWLGNAMGKEITSLAKAEIDPLIHEAGPGIVSEVLGLRKRAAKTSIKKYAAMLNCTCQDGRAHGLFQYYGANRTGRWAGRLIQLQNLPRNKIESLDLARSVVRSGDRDLMELLYSDTSSILSQLIRTAFVAPEGKIFAVADFSAIEARVIAWLADEKWRMKVFNSHGKIYEASASTMFRVPIEHVTKDSDYRRKAKIAELALGYQGALGALKKMGGEEMGLSEAEMAAIVQKWRRANPAICQLWGDIEGCAKQALENRTKIVSRIKGLVFEYNGDNLSIKLPSGRSLFYQSPGFTMNKFNNQSIKYQGMNQETKKWEDVETYGGKLTENVVQAIARDLLSEAMLRLDTYGYLIVMHVHDEVVCEVEDKSELAEVCRVMSISPDWASGLPLTADGYTTPFYKKD